MEEDEVGELTLPNFMIYHKAAVIKYAAGRRTDTDQGRERITQK